MTDIQHRCCDRCNYYKGCYITPFGNNRQNIICRDCLLKIDGGEEWLETHERNEAYRNRPDRPDKGCNDYAFHDWYSTAPRMSGSSRLTNEGQIVKQNGYNNRRDEDY